MSEAYVRILCPECTEDWEENPVDLSEPDDPYECPHCGAVRPTAEFMRTARDLEILEEFHT